MTIYDVLENALYNIKNNGDLGVKLGAVQLENAIKRIDEGKDLHDEFEEEV